MSCLSMQFLLTKTLPASLEIQVFEWTAPHVDDPVGPLGVLQYNLHAVVQLPRAQQYHHVFLWQRVISLSSTPSRIQENFTQQNSWDFTPHLLHHK